jgi:murein DD-endopeptidase MepM/ murein hydrolase activator NlpD
VEETEMAGKNWKLLELICTCALACVLAACGGGGSDGGADGSGAVNPDNGSSPSSPSPPSPPDSVSGTISSAAGGSLALQGVASLDVGAGVLPADATVLLEKTASAALQQRFEETASLFGTATRATAELRIDIGSAQPTGPVSVRLQIPASLKSQAKSSDEIRALYLNVYDDGGERHETVELLQERATATDETLTVTLPPEAFHEIGTRFQAYVILALTPTAQQNASAAVKAVISAGTLAATADQCRGTSIQSPVDSQFSVSSPFGPRPAPKKNASTNHPGVDYAVPEGTDIKAAADGVVTKVKIDSGDINVGYGYYMEVTHASGITRYAHLTQGSALGVGTKVSGGQVIAKSGNTGNSTGPHLHFEYAPKGTLFADDTRVDPVPCIAAIGSLSISDNGTAADDAFSVTLDGQQICSTTIGAANNCALGQLRPGTYTLGLTAFIAPDNVGTYLIVLSNPSMSINGSSSVSGTLPQGGTTDFSLVVQ